MHDELSESQDIVAGDGTTTVVVIAGAEEHSRYNKNFFLSLPHLGLSLSQDGLFLLRVKLGLSDPNGALTDWNDRDATPCNWTGITCDPATGSVSSVDLSNAGLAGPLLPLPDRFLLPLCGL
ncbi:hypothetical protein TEA_019852 [Camellia sinensis var. sinensis]|uniref:Leucine-rich repeat-containing N-terminal plant-type domain-containing protein n=1 Tax=Camellia sinensis var. sinensis TaxID=542762 RepID=A0A4S4EY89_CAMSN|nr:hypothetical protein TEA_019852 [Camellia sinensis var. sinensis]